jgi:hypothetical protein
MNNEQRNTMLGEGPKEGKNTPQLEYSSSSKEKRAGKQAFKEEVVLNEFPSGETNPVEPPQKGSQDDDSSSIKKEKSGAPDVTGVSCDPFELLERAKDMGAAEDGELRYQLIDENFNLGEIPRLSNFSNLRAIM